MLLAQRVVAMLLAGVLLATTPALVAAFNLLPHRAGYNSAVSFNHSSLTTNIHNAAHFTDTENVEPTDISTSLYHNTAGREVSIYDSDYQTTAWYGRWFCQTADGNVCLDGRVQINLRFQYNETQARSLVCEEIGHAVSLDHSLAFFGSCMSQNWDQTRFGNHDRSEINSRY